MTQPLISITGENVKDATSKTSNPLLNCDLIEKKEKELPLLLKQEPKTIISDLAMELPLENEVFSETNFQNRINDISSLDKVSSAKEATYHILTTPGFMADSEDDLSYYGMLKGEIQGNKALRKTVASVTKQYPEAIGLKAFKDQRELNIEQYMTIKIKRFAHALNMKGHISVPSGKKSIWRAFAKHLPFP